jgi:hypothetical protein
MEAFTGDSTSTEPEMGCEHAVAKVYTTSMVPGVVAAKVPVTGLRIHEGQATDDQLPVAEV